MRAAAEADLYLLSHHYKMFLPSTETFVAFQPWLKRFHGEKPVPGSVNTILGMGLLPRLWIDQNLKNASR